MMSSSQVQTAGVCVRKMTPDDLRTVSGIHCSVFSGQFLTLTGPQLIQRFYEQFIRHSSSHAFVASRDGKVVGFVAGTTNKHELFQGFYRANLLRIGMKAAISPPIWSAMYRNINGRRSHVKRALQALVSSPSARIPPAQSAPDSRIPNRLMSIAVCETSRGHGIAEELVDAFCRQLWDEGVEEVGLSVLAHNSRAIRFYERTCWIREHESKAAVYFYKSTRPGTQG